MKLLFEGYQYDLGTLKGLLEDSLYVRLSNGKATIPYVGYYHSPDIEDSVFILPKVFVSNVDGQDRAFGRYSLDSIINVDSSNETTNDDLKGFLGSKDNEVVFGLSTWLYQAISLYDDRIRDNDISKDAYIQNVVSTKGDESETFLDVVLSLKRFHKDHKNLFTFISNLSISGRYRINWDKTINRTQAILQDETPLYLSPISKSHTINYDEELIILFYSVLNYLKGKYNFSIDKTLEYKLIPSQTIENYIASGKGLRLLRSIRYKYYTDELVALWNLLKVFFTKAYDIANKNYHSEKLLVRNFNLVFEDMIDSIIGEDHSLDELKNQKDGKIIDHIYKGPSLIPESEVYFIGDSKYYKDSTDLSGSALYKQYTYAKNVIQYNIDIFNSVISPKTGSDRSKIKYLDVRTEGYNPTPNFFIRGSVDTSSKNYPNYDDDELVEDGDERVSYHFHNRLFDRDTLILQTYNINFLFVMSAYVSQTDNSELRSKLRLKFRKDIIEILNRRYVFYKLIPRKKKGEDYASALNRFLDKHFRRLSGKIYQNSETDGFIWLAMERVSFDKNNEHFNDVKDESILAEINQDCSPQILEAERLQ